jgi:hypothetical protein
MDREEIQKHFKYVYTQLRDEIKGKTFSQVFYHVNTQVCTQVGSKLLTQCMSEIWDGGGQYVNEQVWAQLKKHVSGCVLDQVEKQIYRSENQMRQMIWTPIRDQI